MVAGDSQTSPLITVPKKNDCFSSLEKSEYSQRKILIDLAYDIFPNPINQLRYCHQKPPQ